MAIRYAWDPKKAAANRAKHGVSFEMAREAFKDPLAVRRMEISSVFKTIKSRVP